MPIIINLMQNYNWTMKLTFLLHHLVILFQVLSQKTEQGGEVCTSVLCHFLLQSLCESSSHVCPKSVIIIRFIQCKICNDTNKSWGTAWINLQWKMYRMHVMNILYRQFQWEMQGSKLAPSGRSSETTDNLGRTLLKRILIWKGSWSDLWINLNH